MAQYRAADSKIALSDYDGDADSVFVGKRWPAYRTFLFVVGCNAVAWAVIATGVALI